MTSATMPSVVQRRPATLHRRPSGATKVALGALVVLLFSRKPLSILDLDLYHQMALWRAALRQGWIPFDDLFAYTSDAHLSVHYEWGNGAIAYTATSLLGATGILMLAGLLICTAAVLAMRAARRNGGEWPVVCALAPVAIVLAAMAFSTVRAGLFTLVFTTALLNSLAAHRCGNRRWVLLWLPTFLLGLNIHPGFIVGAELVVLHGVEALLRSRRVPFHLLAVVAAMLGLVLVNPYGLLYPGAVLHAITVPLPPIREWLPVWRFESLPLQTAYGVSLVVVAYAVMRAGWRHINGILPVLVCAAVAFQHVRLCYLYAAVWFCYVPGWMRYTPLGSSLERGWARSPGLVVTASLTVAVTCLPRLVRPCQGIRPSGKPTTCSTQPARYSI